MCHPLNVRQRFIWIAFYIFPRWLICSYGLIVCGVYAFVAVHAPIAVLHDAPHDDGLFMTLAVQLENGDWLGAYNPMTLVKGAGYSIFLALVRWLGISVTLGTGLFHCAVMTFVAWTCNRLIRSQLISGLLLLFLVWHPYSLSVHLLRVIREAI